MHDTYLIRAQTNAICKKYFKKETSQKTSQTFNNLEEMWEDASANQQWLAEQRHST